MAYNISSDAKQKIKSIDWTDLYSEPNRDNDELQVIHLHGFAPFIAKNKSKLIFSILEYLQATSERHAWHRIFGDEFLQRPFIIVGAKLSDEFDLADIIRRGNSSDDYSGRPSIIILKEIPSYQKVNLIKWGLIPIEGTAEDFFKTISPKVTVREKEIFAFSKGKLSLETLLFLNQFRWLKIDDKHRINNNHDFYLGDDPEWSDILEDKDAIFEISTKVLSCIKSDNSNPSINKQTLYCISGPPGSGKSAASLRIARELIKVGHDVFWFKSETKLNVASVKWCIDTFTNPVFIFDNFADFANDVGNLILESSKSNAKLIVIGTERDQRMQHILQGISADNLVMNGLKTDHLTDDDITRLISKLESNNRLGKITRFSKSDKIGYFKKYAKRQLLVGMGELEGGKGFPQRIKSECDSISNEIFKQVYEISCFTYSLGYQLPLAIACAATGANAKDVINSIKNNGELSGVMVFDYVGLRPRHRVIASLLIENVLSKQDRYELTLLLAKTLSPYITIRTISQRTIPYRIVRRLMDEQLVYDWLGTKTSREWYEALAVNYKWNARYWEQRALLEARLGQFPRARSYAEEAVRKQKHPFTLNTLGSILTRMAIDYHLPGSKESYEMFVEGLKNLKEARDIRDDDTIHSFTTFFTRTLAFAKLTYTEKGNLINEKLTAEWNSWMQQAKRATIFSHADNKSQLDEYHKNWLLLAVKDPRP